MVRYCMFIFFLSFSIGIIGMDYSYASDKEKIQAQLKKLQESINTSDAFINRQSQLLRTIKEIQNDPNRFQQEYSNWDAPRYMQRTMENYAIYLDNQANHYAIFLQKHKQQKQQLQNEQESLLKLLDKPRKEKTRERRAD